MLDWCRGPPGGGDGPIVRKCSPFFVSFFVYFLARMFAILCVFFVFVFGLLTC